MKLTFNQAIMRKQYTFFLALSAALVLTSCGGEKEEEEKKEVVTLSKVTAEGAEVKDFSHWIELQGSIEAPKDVMLTPVMGGTIKKIYVEEGQMVKRGQIIAIMDNDVVASSISEAQAALNNAVYNYKKQEELYTAGVGTEFQYRQAFDQKELAEKRVQSLRVQAGKAAVYAPFDGLINDIFPSEGEAGGPGAPICHIVGLEKLTVVTQISESFINLINDSTDVAIIIPSLDTTLDSVKINRIGKYINPQNRTFKIYIDIDNNDGSIVPNMITRVKIKDAAFPQATLVKNSSIQYNKEGKTYVFSLSKLDSSKYVSNKLFVNSLSSYGNYTAIETHPDIATGTHIVVQGAEGITDKDTVEILK